MDKKKVIYQYDNDSKYKVKSVQQWLTEQSYNVMEWLSQLLDLNPIENLWATLKRWIYACKPPPKDLGELQTRVKGIWNTIGSDECARLVASMRDRVDKRG
jgi:hypothetical protein